MSAGLALLFLKLDTKTVNAEKSHFNAGKEGHHENGKEKPRENAYRDHMYKDIKNDSGITGYTADQ